MSQKVREFLVYRELLFNLVKRELKVKYKGSILGFFWSFVNPLLLMLVYTLVFSFFLRIAPPEGANGLKSFPAFLLTGLFAWNYFVNSLSGSVGSIVDSGNLIKKVYFPREIIPFSIVFANLINFLLELVVIFGFLLVLGNNFLIFLPILLLVVLIETVFILGLSLFFSVSHVYFRDTKHLLGVILTLWFFASPIIYPLELVVDAATRYNLPGLIFLYKLNPMASLTLTYQKMMYFLDFPSVKLLAYTLGVALVFFVIGYALFNRYELAFAEEV